MPPRCEGRFSRVVVFSEDEVEGKMVERVPVVVRERMRRARMAESWIEGM